VLRWQAHRKDLSPPLLKAEARHNAVLDCKYASSSRSTTMAPLKFVRAPISIDFGTGLIADENDRPEK